MDYKSLYFKCLSEFIGSLLIVLFGVGSVCSAVLTNSMVGLWQVAVVWGFGVTIAILVSKKVSGAHLNPAVTIALGLTKRHDAKELVPYIFSQMLGGIVGGFINFMMFYDFLKKRDSVFTAMVFGEYYPNPGLFREQWENGNDPTIISTPKALLIEAFGTFILMFNILTFTHKNQEKEIKKSAPFFIGFTVSCLISLYAPLTQAGWNPMRDFGPRIAAWILGYGKIAIPGPRNGFWIYILGPIIGSCSGALFFDLTLNKALNTEDSIPN